MIRFNELTPSGDLRRKLDAIYDRVMTSGTYIRGLEMAAFEEEWAEYIGAKHCIAVASGSDALRFLVDEVAVVPWNATPTIDALRRRSLVLADTGRNRTIAATRSLLPVVAVHLYGMPADVDQIETPLLIEDAAQAHGARYKGQMCGTLGDAAVWSFYPTKNLGAYGDAGAVTTDSDDLAAELRQIRMARMDPLQAGFLRVKLPYLAGWNSRRREIAAIYRETLEVETLDPPNWTEPCWHLFPVFVKRRDEMKQKLAARGIETLVHYAVDETELSLPIGPHVTDEEARYVARMVNECAS